MSNKPNILRKPNEQIRNIIITILIIIVFACIGAILYFVLYQNKETAPINRMPFLELYGDTNIILNRYDPFVEYGYYAYDLEDGDLTKKVTIQSDVNTNKPGIYTISYVVNDTGKQSVVKTRTVVVKSSNYEFNFDVKGEKLILLKKGNRYTDPGYLVMSGDQNLTDTVKVLGEVNGEEEGIYTIHYVCEYNHQVAVYTRKVIVSSSLNVAELSDNDLEHISNYNIKELKNSYKITPNHFSSKTILILAFSICKNDGMLTDDEIANCFESTFELSNLKISHQTYYDLINGNISFDNANLKWNVQTNLLVNQLEENLKSLKQSMRLSLEENGKLYIYVEDDDLIYKYTFNKKEASYLFASVDVF